VRYARALSAAPSTTGDWSCSEVTPAGGYGGTVRLAHQGGKPVIGMCALIGYGSTGEDVLMATATTSQPAGATDWQIEQIDSAGPFGLELGLLSVPGAWLATYARNNSGIWFAYKVVGSS